MSKLFLLSEEEYLKNKDYIQSESSWWLRTSGAYSHGYTVRYVYSDNDVYTDYAYYGYYGVRPAFKFQSDIYKDKPVGCIIHFGRLDWIKLNDGIYLSKDIMFNYHFAIKGSDYIQSDVKKKLKECELWWFTKTKLRTLKDFEEV